MLTASVVGSGPNGLTAAILLARAGFKTTIYEAEPQFGGGLRSAELTLPGYTHDVCSAVHPLAACSPVFATVPLAEHGLKWIHSPVPMAHPISADRCAVLHHSLARTMEGLGKDAASYRRAVEPLVSKWDVLVKDLLAPLHFPADPVLFARFGLLAILSARQAVNLCFNTQEAKALFAGASAHSILPLEEQSSAAIGWVLMAAAHAVGWPIPRGGSQSIANALASYFQSIGGTLVTGARISNLRDLPPDGPILCDVGPRQLLQIAGDSFPTSFAKKLEAYRYGPGAFKLDWALSAPIPWKATACRQAGTVHIGGTFEEVAAAERAPWAGVCADNPFVLLTQPSLFDVSRAPAGKHTAWAYCHVPNGAKEDMTPRVEDQIERFAPGFRSLILARSVLSPAVMESHNANLIGGDITGGAMNLSQLFARPTRTLYRTPLRRVYLCSASTPPGAGVHGMCGFHAARAAIKDHASA